MWNQFIVARTVCVIELRAKNWPRPWLSGDSAYCTAHRGRRKLLASANFWSGRYANQLLIKYEVRSPKFIGAPCAQLYSLAEAPQPPPPQLGSKLKYCTSALLVIQDRRHIFVTPWLTLLHIFLQSSLQRRFLRLLGLLSRRILYKLQNSDKILYSKVEFFHTKNV